DGPDVARTLGREAIEVRLVLAPTRQRLVIVPGLNRARLDPTPEFESVLRAAIRILVEASKHDRFELRRNREPSRRQRRGLLVEVLAADLHDRLAIEDIDAREQVVRDRPDGVNVGTGVHRARIEDGLRGHVLWRTHYHAGAGQRDVSTDFKLFDEAEVEQL